MICALGLSEDTLCLKRISGGDLVAFLVLFLNVGSTPGIEVYSFSNLFETWLSPIANKLEDLTLNFVFFSCCCTWYK